MTGVKKLCCLLAALGLLLLPAACEWGGGDRDAGAGDTASRQPSGSAAPAPQEEGPLLAARQALDALKALDSAAFLARTRCAGDSALLRDGYNMLAGAPSEEARPLLEALAAHLTYELGEVRVEGEKAAIQARVSSLELKSVLAEALGASFLSVLAGEEGTGSLLERLPALLETAESVSSQVTLHLQREGDGWVLLVDEELGDALGGGLLSGLEELGPALERLLPQG